MTAVLPFEQLGVPFIVSALAFFIISLGIHEAAHAWAALRCGDTTARDMGRITLNPIAHIDLFMTILLPLFLLMSGTGLLFGGAKPVPVAYHRLRNPLRDMMLVALAGPVSNFLLAIVFMLAWKGIHFFDLATESVLPGVFHTSIVFNLLLAVFNMVPLPPLDGSRVMAWLLPESLREPYVGLERWGMLLILPLFFVPAFRSMLWGGIQTGFDLVNFITGGQWW